MTSISIFCPTCGRYLGLSSYCPECQQDKPLIHRLPQPQQPLWQTSLPMRSACPPIYAQGVLYTADHTATVTAYHAVTGQPLWSAAIPGQPRRDMALYNGILYLGTKTGQLVALNSQTGQLLAPPYALSGSVGSPFVDRQTLYIGDSGGYVHALRLNGAMWQEVWRTSTGQYVGNAPVKANHFLLIVNRHADGYIRALDAQRGQEVWKHPLHDRAYTPVVAGAHVLVGKHGGEVTAYSLHSHALKQIWTYAGRTALSAPPAADATRVFIGDNNGSITALTLANGRSLWQKTYLNIGTIHGLAFWEGLLFAATASGGLLALEAETGSLAWQWQPGEAITMRPAVHDGIIYAGGKTSGWFALPWHLGQWAWAAAWSERKGWWETAAALHALSGQSAQAEALWFKAGQPQLAAQLWHTLGANEKAARAYRQAAETEQATSPGKATGSWLNAAAHFDWANMPFEANDCRRRAGRMGQAAYLRLESFNLPAFEAHMPGQVTLWLSNLGNAPARHIRICLGGMLERAIEYELPRLDNGRSQAIILDQVTPSTISPLQLKIRLQYDDGGKNGIETTAEWEMTVMPPRPGAIRVGGDAVIMLRGDEEGKRPSISVAGNAVIIKRPTQ